MSRILCVWELGTGYGHLGRLLPVALELRQRGHEVVFALRDLTHAEAFLGRRGFRLLQSPVWMGEGRGGDSPLNYAELLGNFGFLDEAGLTGMAKAWRELYSLTLADLLEVEEDFLCTFPELDPSSRTGARYWGPVFTAEEGVAPVWPQGSTERIFAYLLPRYRDFDRVMDQLLALPYRTLVHAPGLSDKQTKKYQTRNVILSPEPVHIMQASRECDLVICHGGTSTCAAALLAARPVLVLHLQIEQLLLAQGLVDRGLAKTVNPDSRSPNYKQMIRDILSDTRFAERAREFAAKYADFDLSRQPERIATRCEEIVAGEIYRKT